jgi:hypothetical protein
LVDIKPSTIGDQPLLAFHDEVFFMMASDLFRIEIVKELIKHFSGCDLILLFDSRCRVDERPIGQGAGVEVDREGEREREREREQREDPLDPAPALR